MTTKHLALIAILISIIATVALPEGIAAAFILMPIAVALLATKTQKI